MLQSCPTQTGVRLIFDPLPNPNTSANMTSPAFDSPNGSHTPKTDMTVRMMAMIAILNLCRETPWVRTGHEKRRRWVQHTCHICLQNILAKSDQKPTQRSKSGERRMRKMTRSLAKHNRNLYTLEERKERIRVGKLRGLWLQKLAKPESECPVLR